MRTLRQRRRRRDDATGMSHRVLTGEGAVTVQVPQVRETEKVFQSKILDAYVSRTEKLDVIARMYVHRDVDA